MRYEDWDVLLFPQECGTPVKEFSVACRVVHDAGKVGLLPQALDCNHHG